MQTLKTQSTKVKYFIHISDIHIRNLRRHEEYKEVFEELYKYIKTLNYKREECLIVCTGDVAHTKTDISPELVDMIIQLFTKLIEFHDLILIAGNHDANLNNENRLDVLSPIVSAINSDKIFYLDKTDSYIYNNINFYSFSLLDNTDKELELIDNENVNVALYHGVVKGCKTDTGFEFKDTGKDVNFFSRFEYVLCGDIHKRQSIGDKGNIWMPSSVIQQDHGESLNNHGGLVWNLETKEVIPFNLKNNYGFHTIFLDENKVLTTEKISKNPRLRILANNCDKEFVYKYISELKSNYNVKELVSHIDTINSDKEHQEVISDLKNIQNEEYQLDLINKYLTVSEPEFTPEIFEFIKEINTECNNKVKASENLGYQNNSWKPLTWNYSNLFAFNENNSIDFTKLKGVVGLFAPNHTGKSSLGDSLLFTLFDKTSRTSKGSDILNFNSNKFFSNLEIKLNDNIFSIERRGIRNLHNTDNVRVETDFENKTTNKSLNGKDRFGTDEVIRDYIGSYDIATLTTFCNQENNLGIISKSNTERKQLLGYFIGTDYLDKLSVSASSERKRLDTIIKHLETKKLFDLYTFAENDMFEYKRIINNLEDELLPLKDSLEENSNKIKELEKQIINIDNSYDISDLNKKIVSYNNLIDISKNRMLEIDNSIKEINEKVNSLNIEMKSIESNELLDYENKTIELNNGILVFKDSLLSNSKSIKELENQIINIDNSYNISDLNRSIVTYSKLIEISKNKILEIDNSINEIGEKVTSLNNEIKSYKVEDSESKMKELDNLNIKLKEIERSINIKTTEQNNTLEKTEILDTLEYDKDCKYCMNFVKDAIIAKETHSVTEKYLNKLFLDKKEVESKIVELLQIKTNLETIEKLKNLKRNYKDQYTILTTEKDSNESKINLNEQLIEESNKKINIYNKNLEQIKINEKINLQISDLQIIKTNIEKQINELNNEILHIKNNLDKVEKLKNLSFRTKDQITILTTEKESCNSKIELNNQLIEETNDKIKIYNKNLEHIKNNEKINLQISNLQTIKTELDKQIKELNNRKLEIIKKISICENKQSELLKEIEEYKLTNKRWKAYSFYETATSRHGIQYQLIKQIVPFLQSKVNMILNELCDFSLEFILDEKNIDIKLKYNDSDKSICLEMASGMEKFVSNIALRIALKNISIIPLPNFLFIDEGFSVLDDSNLNNLTKLFQYLKNEFDFILVISHIDKIKDMVDDIIYINTENNQTKINYPVV